MQDAAAGRNPFFIPAQLQKEESDRQKALTVDNHMSKYRFTEIKSESDIGRFNAFTDASEQHSMFQNTSWADIKYFWDHHYFTVTDENGDIVAAAMCLFRKLPLGFTYAYCPRGPIVDYRNQELVTFLFDNLLAFAKKQRAVVFKCDPRIFVRRYPFAAKEEAPKRENTDIITTLENLKLKHKGFTTGVSETIQPRFEVGMEITPDCLEGLTRKTKQSIRGAIRKGAKVKIGHEYLDEFMEAISKTEEKQNIKLRDKEYFRKFTEVYGDNAIVMITYINFPEQIEQVKKEIQEIEEKLAGQLSKQNRHIQEVNLKNANDELVQLQQDYEKEQKDTVILGGQFALIHGKQMELMYQGNNTDYLRIRASYLMYHECLKMCIEKGIEYCSFGGVDGTLDDHLSRFKSNFPIIVEEFIGEFSYVFKPLLNTIIDKYLQRQM